MTRREPRMSTFDSFHSLAEQSISVQQQPYRNERANWNNQVDDMRSLNLNDAYFESSERNHLPYQPLYRDSTGVASSLLITDGTMDVDTSQHQSNLTGSGLDQRQHRQGAGQSRHGAGSASKPNDSRKKSEKSTFRDMLPPGFPIPQASSRKTVQPTAEPSQQRYERSETSVQPITTKSQVSRVIRPVPAFRRGSSFGAYKVKTLPAIYALETKPDEAESQIFQIQETDKVIECLTDKFYSLQQQSLKAIAKAWIKLICPKKQARFPYSNKRKRAGAGASTGATRNGIPPWWPALNLCQYKEPDHIHASERVNLLIHLIRLRPSQEDIDSWNEEDAEVLQPSTLRPLGEWVTFLQQATPISLFAHVTREPLWKAERRPELLQDIFRVADMEEQFLIGGIDGTDTVTWVPNPDARPTDRRCTIEPNLADAYDAESSVGDTEPDAPDGATSNEPQKMVKRVKRIVSTEKVGQTRDARLRRSRQGRAVCRSRAPSPSPSPTEEIVDHAYLTPGSDLQLPPILPPLRSSNHQIDSSKSTSLTTSFDSNASIESDWSNGLYEPRQLHVTDCVEQCNNFRQYQYPQVNAVYSLPQPRFAPTPIPQGYRNILVPAGTLAAPLQSHPMESQNKPSMLTFFDAHVPPGHVLYDVPGSQTFLNNGHQIHHVPATRTQEDTHMTMLDPWPTPMHGTDSKEYILAQSDHRYTDAAGFNAAGLNSTVAMQAEQHAHSSWTSQYQRPSGLPMQYEPNTMFDFESAGAALD